tara:strand:+ start:388 stop:714 length:327 start_codon:yes stop_codon:yes gene_type:complete
MTAIRKSETSEEKLRRMCKNIAEGITDGTEVGESADEFMRHVYSIRYLVDSEKKYLGAMLMVAGGGPTIWVNTRTSHVEGSWWGDKCEYYYIDNIGLDDYNEEMYNCI